MENVIQPLLPLFISHTHIMLFLTEINEFKASQVNWNIFYLRHNFVVLSFFKIVFANVTLFKPSRTWHLCFISSTMFLACVGSLRIRQVLIIVLFSQLYFWFQPQPGRTVLSRLPPFLCCQCLFSSMNCASLAFCLGASLSPQGGHPGEPLGTHACVGKLMPHQVNLNQ